MNTELIIALALGITIIIIVRRKNKKITTPQKIIFETPQKLTTFETDTILRIPQKLHTPFPQEIEPPSPQNESGREIETFETIKVPKQDIISAPYITVKDYVYVLIPSVGVVAYLLYRVRIRRVNLIAAKILQSLRKLPLPDIRKYFRNIGRDELINEKMIDELDEQLKLFDQQPQTPSKSNFFGTPPQKFTTFGNGKEEVYINFEEETIVKVSPRKLDHSDQIDEMTDVLLKDAEVYEPEGEISYDTIKLSEAIRIKDKILSMKRRDMLLKIKKLKEKYEEGKELSQKDQKKVEEDYDLFDRYSLRSSGHEFLTYIVAFIELYSTKILNSNEYKSIKKNTNNFSSFNKVPIQDAINDLFNLIIAEQKKLTEDL